MIMNKRICLYVCESETELCVNVMTEITNTEWLIYPYPGVVTPKNELLFVKI